MLRNGCVLDGDWLSLENNRNVSIDLDGWWWAKMVRVGYFWTLRNNVGLLLKFISIGKNIDTIGHIKRFQRTKMHCIADILTSERKDQGFITVIFA